MTWEARIAESMSQRPAATRAHTFHRRLPGASGAILLTCDDGRDYAVKCLQAGRVLCNEQIVGVLGMAIGAPVGQVAYVDVPAELVSLHPDARHATAGVSHGSLFLSGCSDRAEEGNTDLVENRARFALLAVLYGWVHAGDHQFIYRHAPPPLVYSVDHGHFFVNGPEWREEHLRAAPPPQPDARIVQRCVLTRDELQVALAALHSIDLDSLVRAVAAPLDHWGLSMSERVQLAEYLSARRATMLQQNGLPVDGASP